MDWIRYPYTTKARVHNSPDAPLVDLVWYPTSLPFQEHESVINSHFQLSEDKRQMLLGEKWFYAPKYNGRKEITGLAGDHECGELSDFQDGQPWPYTGPPIEYDADDIPLCCPRERIVVMGGGQVSAVVHYTAPPPYGPTCCDAPLNVFGTTYRADYTVSGSRVDWWCWEVSAGEVYTLEISKPEPMFAGSVIGYVGPTCVISTVPIFSLGLSGPIVFTAPIDGTLCIKVDANWYSPSLWYEFGLLGATTPRLTGGGLVSAVVTYTGTVAGIVVGGGLVEADVSYIEPPVLAAVVGGGLVEADVSYIEPPVLAAVVGGGLVEADVSYIEPPVLAAVVGGGLVGPTCRTSNRRCSPRSSAAGWCRRSCRTSNRRCSPRSSAAGWCRRSWITTPESRTSSAILRATCRAVGPRRIHQRWAIYWLCSCHFVGDADDGKRVDTAKHCDGWFFDNVAWVLHTHGHGERPATDYRFGRVLRRTGDSALDRTLRRDTKHRRAEHRRNLAGRDRGGPESRNLLLGRSWWAWGRDIQ